MTTIDHQIAELKRELALRKNVYPKFVAKGTMRQAEADLSTERMTAALHTVMAVKRLRATMMEHRWIGVGLACSCGTWNATMTTETEPAIALWLDLSPH